MKINWKAAGKAFVLSAAILTVFGGIALFPHFTVILICVILLFAICYTVFI